MARRIARQTLSGLAGISPRRRPRYRPLRDRSQASPGAASACQNLAESDRPEPPEVDPDIELPGLRLQPSVTMAVQVDPALPHAAPGAKRVMAEHQRYAVRRDLGVGLHAFPTLQLCRRRRIVVAGEEMLAAVKPTEEISNHFPSLANGEIAEMPNIVIRPDRLVPALHDSLVHHRDRRERPAIESQGAAMAKMRVAGEENGHVIRRSVAPNPQATVMSVCGKSLPLNRRGTSSSL